ncbi:hypothetical protein [Pseudomonas sp. CNPSo 3701]|uniref:hypothetical protein n=1 Tax=Pseudomonas sp. CNPSo 3701 TaxID=3027943 RepID=UPI00236441B4|nr:hypothetical protein [Pseudomonas sp. CNPSo 3701]MDD1510204.1 hypothetical protein [Pseudomonas sp. CNPSo 3701]
MTRMGLLSACLLLGACQTELKAPRYSPGYQTVVDGNGQTLLVPDACRRVTNDGQPVDERELLPLPPGCANNANLLQMVERRGDLLRGRQTGPTLAAPVGRAAQSYLEGFETDEKRRRRQEQAAQSETGGGQ